MRQRPVDAGRPKVKREAERVGSIGDIALEKALPFDGANSGTASLSADADSVSILTTIDAVVYDWDVATAILILAIAPILRKSRLCFGSSSDSTIRWAFSMI